MQQNQVSRDAARVRSSIYTWGTCADQEGRGGEGPDSPNT